VTAAACGSQAQAAAVQGAGLDQLPVRLRLCGLPVVLSGRDVVPVRLTQNTYGFVSPPTDL
jgi:hypothetical protein